MRLIGADIYCQHIYTDKITKFKSLKKACTHIFNLPKEEQEVTLLCVGNWNLDYITRGESLENYYNRMKEMAQKI